MKATLTVLAIIAIFAISISSCKKDDSSNNLPGSFSSLQEFYDKYSVKSQLFFVDPTVSQTITGNQGTKITFNANTLIKSNGMPVSGNVIVELKEIYKKSDMLYADKPTVTSTIPLKSGGEVFLKAVLASSGEVLQLKDTTPAVSILFPDTVAADTMFAFIGDLDSLNNFIWQPVAQNGWPTVAFNTLGGYVIETDTLTWINCDQPIHSNPWVKLTLDPLENPISYVTDVFLFFPDRIMVHVYRNYPYNSFVYNFTPSNKNFTAVAIGFKDGKLYASFVPISTTTTNKTVNFSLQEISETDLTQAIDALN